MKSGLHSRINNALPILFVYIGWAERYDGTEPIRGEFSYFKNKDAEISEAYAFHRDTDGFYRCGVGRGQVLDPALNVVLVARDDRDGRMKIVGLYLEAKIDMDDYWAVAVCKTPILIAPQIRPVLKKWPRGQGLRRWAARMGKKGKEYPSLRLAYEDMLKNIHHLASLAARNGAGGLEFNGFEGKLKRRFVLHRSRENRLRLAKIRQALEKNKGRLLCEVPRCGFDFAKQYGKIGAGYAHVHHLTPLSSAPRKGTTKNLSDLAIVCANCHAMIHNGGECRSLNSLVPR